MRSNTRAVLGIIAIVAAAGLLLGACTQSSEPKGDVGSGPAEGRATDVIALDNRFSPEELTFETGDEVTIEVINDGDSNHEFAIESLDLTTGTIEPGKTAHATFVVPEGSTEFACTYHGGMDGEIVAERA
jgi:plastocyanin